MEEANNARLEALTGEEQTYYAQNIPGLDMNDNLISMPQACKLLDNTLAPRALRLRPGAQVMLTVVSAYFVSYQIPLVDYILERQRLWSRQWLHRDCSEIREGKRN